MAESILVPLLVAIIMGGPTWLALRRVRRENDEQHQQGRDIQSEVLEELRGHRRETNERLDSVNKDIGAMRYEMVGIRSRLYLLETAHRQPT